MVIKIKKPGAFRSYCRRNGFSKVNTACINKGKKSKNKRIRKRAVLADNFKKMRAKKNKRK